MQSFLSQLRDGYVNRADTPFPRSVALVGMRNIRDYKVRIRPDSETLGSSSPFNIITEILTLSDFTLGEIRALYSQHTEAAGQAFADEAIQSAWYWSEGQPWLVSALARQAVEKILARDYSQAVTAKHIDEAADILMRRRDPHINSLLARLKEPRVRRFIEPMLALSNESAINYQPGGSPDTLDDDLQYCLDLGIVKRDGKLRPANPIYASCISRYVSQNVQEDLPDNLTGRWMDGRTIDMTGLLKEFQKFWAGQAERYFPGLLYLETAPHGLLTAFLQRAVNGGAVVTEEYANGLGFADIVIKYAGRTYVIELKIKDNQKSLAKSKKQILGYMDRLLVNEGWLLVFDRKSDKSWARKITWETETMPSGQVIHVAGC